MCNRLFKDLGWLPIRKECQFKAGGRFGEGRGGRKYAKWVSGEFYTPVNLPIQLCYPQSVISGFVRYG
jgi:hypothetical protein